MQMQMRRKEEAEIEISPPASQLKPSFMLRRQCKNCYLVDVATVYLDDILRPRGKLDALVAGVPIHCCIFQKQSATITFNLAPGIYNILRVLCKCEFPKRGCNAEGWM